MPSDIASLIARLQAWRETPFEGDPMIDALLVDVPEAADALLALKAENDGLREALERIVTSADNQANIYSSDRECWEDMEQIARAILRGSGEAG